MRGFACSYPAVSSQDVSFVQDLRLVYACPSCKQLVWLPGA